MNSCGHPAENSLLPERKMCQGKGETNFTFRLLHCLYSLSVSHVLALSLSLSLSPPLSQALSLLSISISLSLSSSFFISHLPPHTLPTLSVFDTHTQTHTHTHRHTHTRTHAHRTTLGQHVDTSQQHRT